MFVACDLPASQVDVLLSLEFVVNRKDHVDKVTMPAPRNI